MAFNLSENSIEYKEEKSLGCRKILGLMFGLLVASLLLFYKSGGNVIVIAFSIPSFLFLLLLMEGIERKRSTDYIRLWFSDDCLHCEAKGKESVAVALSDIKRLSIKKQNRYDLYAILIYPKDDQEVFSANFITSSKGDLDAIPQFFKRGMDARGYLVREQNAYSLSSDYQMDYLVKKPHEADLPLSFKKAKKLHDELSAKGASKGEIEEHMWRNGFTQGEIDYATGRKTATRDEGHEEEKEYRDKRQTYHFVWAILGAFALLTTLYYSVLLPNQIARENEEYLASFVCDHKMPASEIYSEIKDRLTANNLNFKINDVCLDSSKRYEGYYSSPFLTYELSTSDLEGMVEFYIFDTWGDSTLGGTDDVKFCFYCYENSELCSGQFNPLMLSDLSTNPPCLNQVNFGLGNKEGTYFDVHIDCTNISGTMLCEVGFEGARNYVAGQKMWTSYECSNGVYNTERTFSQSYSADGEPVGEFETNIGLTDQSLWKLAKLIEENGDSALQSLGGLDCLTYLDLSNQQIRDLSYMPALGQVTKIDISDTNIADLSPLRALTKLNSVEAYNTDCEALKETLPGAVYRC